MYYIGIDLGGTCIKIGLIKEQTLLGKQVISARSSEGIVSHLRLIDKTMDALLIRHGVKKIKGVAMAFPGIVDPFSKKVLSTNKKYEDACSVDLEDYYKKKWKAPFFIDNDSRMAAVAEWKYGMGKGYNDLVMVTLGTGIGTGVVNEGKLMRGKHFQAGCLGGHFVVNYKGNHCSCGNIGCVEAEASSWNIEAFAHKHPGFSESTLPFHGIDFHKIFQTAAQGDTIAKELRDHCIGIWAAGVITYIHAYDPEIIILGGGILNSSADIIPIIQKKVQQHAWTPWGQVEVKKASFQHFGGVIGSVYSLQKNI